MKADAVTPPTDDGTPSHPEHPAVLPRLTYTISDLWDGRMSEAVREQWDALLDILRMPDDQPDEYVGLPRTTYTKIHDRAAPDKPDIQQTIAAQTRMNANIQSMSDSQVPIKSKQWGRILTRG